MTEEHQHPKRPEDFINLDFDASDSPWRNKKKPVTVSILVHLTVFLLLAIPITRNIIVGDPLIPGEILIRFYQKGATGPGGGGGGGGSGGRKPTTYIRARIEEPQPERPPQPREAPIAPRELPPLVFGDDLDVPDLPTDTEMLFGTVFSPDAVPSPGLSFTAGADMGGIDTEPSSGTGGGIGGGEGTGVGEGKGWGVGPGEGGGFGGGQYQPGGWDIEPTLVEEVEPEYPAQAIEHSVRGELIVQVLVKTDGSTTVLRVLKSLPHGCVDAAIAAARKWRWKPALKDGQPVEAAAIITFEFDLISQRASAKRKKG
jgi:TonB family protein